MTRLTEAVQLAPAQLLVLVPAAAALLGLWLGRGRRRTSATVAVLAAVVTLGAAAWQVVEVLRVLGAAPRGSTGTVGPLPVGELVMPLRLLSDDLSALVAVAVGVVGLAVQVFTTWYLREDDRYAQFAASVSLFLAAMLLVVQTGDLVLLLIGWEVMGWCSYLLIGHDTRRESARRAAHKALLVTRIADMAFVIGLIILAVGAGTTSIPDVLAHWSDASAVASAGGGAALTAALLCLLCGIAGKSAQFPFQDWLPDAMEGPTPASALIHAATMVAAGTYVIARLFPLFATSGPARLVLALVTAVSMVAAAVIAFGQSDLKRLLAWSTISQVAIMLSALAAAPLAVGPDAGVLHLLSHAMFKALLFLGIGWLSVLAGGTSAVALSGGVRHFRGLSTPLGVGFLALAGVPPFVGFVSKELILGSAEDGIVHGADLTGWLVLAAVAVTVPLTAAYCTRAWLVLSYRTPQERAVHRQVDWESHHAREVDLVDMFDERTFLATEPEEEPEEEPAGRPISAPAYRSITVLAWLSLLGGLVVLAPLVHLDLHANLWLVGSSLLLMAGAALAVRGLSGHAVRGDAATRLSPRVAAALDTGLGADRAYLALVARPVTRLALAVVALDRDVIDAYVRGSAAATRLAGNLGERGHTRRPSGNLVWVLLGVLGVAVAGVRLW